MKVLRGRGDHQGAGKGTGRARTGPGPGVLATLIVAALMGLALWVALPRPVARAEPVSVTQMRGVYGQIDRALSQTLRELEWAAMDPRVAAAIEAGDRDRIERLENEFGGRIEGTLQLSLLPPGYRNLDRERRPPIGFAALELVRGVEEGDGPLVEAHGAKDEGRHLNFARRVPGPDGTAAGTVLLSTDLGVLQEVLGRSRPPAGYVEVSQEVGSREVAVATTGDPAYRKGPATFTEMLPVPNWRVSYWAGPGGNETVLPREAVIAVVLGVGALLIAGVILLEHRRQRKAVESDLQQLLPWVRQLLAGRSEERGPVWVSPAFEAAEPVWRRALAGARPAVEAGGAAVHDAYRAVGEGREGGEVSAAVLRTGGPPLSDTIFRAYDIRGVVGKTLTPEVVFQIGQAIGSLAFDRGEKGVVVGRDGRLSGPELSDALVRGLMESGQDVIDIGQVPTPVLYFATHHLSHGSGVMLTGSHNPPDYNGLKIVVGGEALSGDAIQELRQRIETGDLRTGSGSRIEKNILRDYQQRILDDVNLARPMHIVVDCGNGAAGGVAPEVYRALGCRVVELFCEVDGRFPNHHPDPGQPRNLEDLITAVRTNGADLGLAFDGDGDRLGVVDADGNIIWPDRQMMLLAEDMLSRHPGADIIFDVKCSRNLARVIAEQGGRPLMWKTGHSLIKAKMKETGALLAGEMSGHIFFKERWYGFDDGIYAGARLLEIVGMDPRSSTEIFAALPDAVSTPEINVHIGDQQKFQFMQRLLQDTGTWGGQATTVDGLRMDFEDGWGLVRPSNTTPNLVLRFEADSETALARIQALFRERLLALESGLELPF